MMTEDDITLRSVVKLNPRISSDTTSYLSGRLYYQKLFSVKDFEINDDGDIDENDSNIRRTMIADFWIKQNPGIILFSNKISSENGSKIISQILFDSTESIKQMKFKIENIERDVQAGLLTGMWAYSFKDRNGNIQKGQLFGDGDVNQDTIFGLTAGAPRNFIGIKKELNDEDTKIKVTRSGSITFFVKDEDLATDVTLQEIIGDLLPYGYLD
ncbi:hypothetical protein [Candidatus Methanoperedens nitratireducens]|nr:hypothetical protein [Candidatus Methanoperedens nitroreducens]